MALNLALMGCLEILRFRVSYAIKSFGYHVCLKQAQRIFQKSGAYKAKSVVSADKVSHMLSPLRDRA